MYRIIYSLLVFLKDLFVRRHIMSSTELTSEKSIICVPVPSRQPASNVLGCLSPPFPPSALPGGLIPGFMSPHTGYPFIFCLPGILCGHLSGGGGAYFLVQKPKWPDTCCPVSCELVHRAGSVLFTTHSDADNEDSRLMAQWTRECSISPSREPSGGQAGHAVRGPRVPAVRGAPVYPPFSTLAFTFLLAAAAPGSASGCGHVHGKRPTSRVSVIPSTSRHPSHLMGQPCIFPLQEPGCVGVLEPLGKSTGDVGRAHRVGRQRGSHRRAPARAADLGHALPHGHFLAFSPLGFRARHRNYIPQAGRRALVRLPFCAVVTGVSRQPSSQAAFAQAGLRPARHDSVHTPRGPERTALQRTIADSITASEGKLSRSAPCPHASKCGSEVITLVTAVVSVVGQGPVTSQITSTCMFSSRKPG